MKKYYHWIELIVISIILIGGIYTVSQKLSLTENAKKDRATVSSIKEQLLKQPAISLDKLSYSRKNQFNGDMTVKKGNFLNGKESGVTVTSTKIPYQACLRYGIEAEGLDAMTINGTTIYRNGEMANRDKILEACMLQPSHSTIKMLVIK